MNKRTILVAPAIRGSIKKYKKVFGFLKSLGVETLYDVSVDADITTWHILHTLKKIIKRSLCSKRAFNSQFDSEETKSYMKYNVTIKKLVNRKKLCL